MDDLACPMVMVLSGVVVSLERCFSVSFSDTHKSKSLKRSRKVFQSFGKVKQRDRYEAPSISNAEITMILNCYHRTRGKKNDLTVTVPSHNTPPSC